MAHNDDCTVLSAAFPDGETISLTAGELKRLKQIASDLTPGKARPAEGDEEPKRGPGRPGGSRR